MKISKTAIGLTAALGLVLLVSACASQPPGEAGEPGFWWGLLHGAIAPFSFIVSLFNDEVRMYAFPNSGRWYDFGFIFGVLLIWGGSGAAARPRRRR
jgi:hypothetical protein